MHLWPTLKLRNSFKLAYFKRIDKATQGMKNEAAERQGLLQSQAEAEETESETIETQKNGGSTSNNSQIEACCEVLLLILCCCTCFCCGACNEEEDSR